MLKMPQVPQVPQLALRITLNYTMYHIFVFDIESILQCIQHNLSKNKDAIETRYIMVT